MKIISILSILIFFLPNFVLAQNPVDSNLKQTMDAIKKGKAARKGEGLEMRDPFKRELPKKSRKKRRYGKGNVFSNRPSLQDVPLENIRIVGVLLGGDRRALAKIGTGGTAGEGSTIDPTVAASTEDIYTIKEGMKLGVNNGEVRAILPGGIVVVEKIRNVYDQDEYLETIIPLSE